MAMERFANAPIPSSPSTDWTTLSAGIDASTTTIPVVGFAAFPSTVQFRIRIDNEYLLVTAGAGTATWTATRGIEGSAAAVHASGASVFHVLTAAGLANHPRSMTTAGDLEYLSAAFAPTRLGIGSAGQVLTVAGGLPTWATPAAGGVTSVALSVPSFLSVTGSPVTTAGTLAVSLATQNANLVFAGPTTGVAAAPTFRSLVAADIPDISAAYLTPAAAAAAYQPLGSYAAASHTHTASQVTDLATASVAFSNKTGAISQWTNDASFTTLAAVAAVGYATATSATAFSNKTGNISQWTNDSGYLTGASADALFTTPAEVTTALGAYLPLSGGTLTGPITGTSGVIEQRDSTTAQTLRIYETYTDASNYSRVSISVAAGGPITFATQALGTGTARDYTFLAASGFNIMTLSQASGLLSVYGGVVIGGTLTSLTTNGLNLLETAGLKWYDVTVTADLGLYRNAAGVAEINNGTPGTLRDLKARTLSFGTHSALAAEALSGFITVTDAGGTTRKLAVIS